jgi:disulfide bond formation protein DsbB
LWIDTFAAEGYASVSPGRNHMLARMLDQVRAQPVTAAAIIIAVVGLMTMGGFFYFQYVLGYPPCPMCLEQRYAFYMAVPLAAMILLRLSLGFSRKVITLALLAIAVAMLWNAGLGAYHSGVEWHWWQGPTECSGAVPNFSAGGLLVDQMNKARVIRCDEAAWRFLGLSLAGYNVLVSLFLSGVAAWGAAAAWRTPDRDYSGLTAE